MDAKLKADWVKALRSGEYRQTQGRLSDGNGFCCLGVLCKVANIELTEDGRATVVDGKQSEYRPIYNLLGEVFPKLYQKNDSGSTFPELADYIEKNL